MQSRAERRPASIAKCAALWSLEVLGSAAFLAGSVVALCGRSTIVETLEKIGIGW